MVFGLRPSSEDIAHYVIFGNNRITNSMRERLGMPKPKKVPDRGNPLDSSPTLTTLNDLFAGQAIVDVSNQPPASLIPTG